MVFAKHFLLYVIVISLASSFAHGQQRSRFGRRSVFGNRTRVARQHAPTIRSHANKVSAPKPTVAQQRQKSVPVKQQGVKQASHMVSSKTGRVAQAGYTTTVSQPIATTSYVSGSHVADCDSCSGIAGLCDCSLSLPLGSAINAYFDAHIVNGYEALQVLYHFDFYNGPQQDASQLNAAGRRKVARLLSYVNMTGKPILVQHTPHQVGLAEARRSNVVAYAQGSLGGSIDDSQVIVGAPPRDSLRGVEAAEIDRNQLQTTRNQGTAGGAGGLSGQTTGSSQNQNNNSRTR